MPPPILPARSGDLRRIYFGGMFGASRGCADPPCGDRVGQPRNEKTRKSWETTGSARDGRNPSRTGSSQAELIGHSR